MIILLSILLYRTRNRKLVKFENFQIPKISKKQLIRRITLSAILIALSTILKSISISTGEIRLGFYEVPVFLSGMVLGPLFGSLVGLGADLIYSLSSGYSFSFIMMCSAIMWGLFGGLFYNKNGKFVNVLIICLITSVLATTINSVQLYIYYGMGMFGNLPNRIITMLIKWPIITFLTWMLNEKVIKVIVKKISKISTKKR